MTISVCKHTSLMIASLSRDRRPEFSPGGNKVQLCAPSALQIMFIVELSVIKPITAEQIKASTRELISSQLSPSLNHATDLMP